MCAMRGQLSRATVVEKNRNRSHAAGSKGRNRTRNRNRKAEIACFPLPKCRVLNESEKKGLPDANRDVTWPSVG